MQHIIAVQKEKILASLKKDLSEVCENIEKSGKLGDSDKELIIETAKKCVM